MTSQSDVQATHCMGEGVGCRHTGAWGLGSNGRTSGMEPSGDRSLAGGASDLEKEWYPTHMELTVVQARSLRVRGRAGTSNPYCIMQLQEQKFQTAVIYRNLAPEWKEQCTFRLPLGISRFGDLKLTVMHKSHRGFDKFLGQIILPIEHIFSDKSKRTNEWFSLLSKPGQREKARGQIQVSLAFMQVLEELSTSRTIETDTPNSLLSRIRKRMTLGRSSTTKQGAPLDTRTNLAFQPLLPCESKCSVAAVEMEATSPLKEVGALVVQQALPMVHPLQASHSDPGSVGSTPDDHQTSLPLPSSVPNPMLRSTIQQSQPEHQGTLKHGASFRTAKKHTRALQEDRALDIPSASGPRNHSLPPLSQTLSTPGAQQRAETLKVPHVRYVQPPADHLCSTDTLSGTTPTLMQRMCLQVRAFFCLLACCVSREQENKDPPSALEQQI